MNRGAPADIEDMAQALNGDLWIAGTRGLFTFDGITFARFTATGNSHLRNDMIYAMYATKKGDVWVGYYSGGASLIRNGSVRHYSEGLPKGPLKQFVEDSKGRIWAISVQGISYLSAGRWHSVRWRTQADDGRLYRMHVDRDGVLWIATSRALLFVRPGDHAVHRTNVDVNESWALAEAPDGRLWLSDQEHGTRPINPWQDKSPNRIAPGSLNHEFVARRILFDAAGNLWASLQTQPGLILVTRPETVQTGAAIGIRDITRWYQDESGLTSNFSGALIEDRQGVIWVATTLGLDKFLPTDFQVRPEFAKNPIHGFRSAQAPNGATAVADDQFVHIYSATGKHEKVGLRASASGLCADGSGRFFIANDDGLAKIEDKRLVSIPLPKDLQSKLALSCQFDRAGNLWVLMRDDGLYRRRGIAWERVLKRDAIGIPWPRAMLIDDQDRLWLGADGAGVNLLIGGALRKFDQSNGLQIGQLHTAIAVPGGVLFGGETGLAFYDGTRFHSLSQNSYPAFNVISGLALDANGYLWLSGTRGVSVFERHSLQAIRRGKGLTLRQHFNFASDMVGFSQINCCANTIIPLASGNIWIFTNVSISSVTPADLQLESPPIRAFVRSVVSGTSQFPVAGAITLQAGSPNLRIDFTSDSLADADQIEFRYRLEGIDPGWVDAGTRRETFYASLPNGEYRFDVEARRSGGTWAPSGTPLTVLVPPTFLQSPMTKLGGAVLAIALLWLAFVLRVRSVAGQIRTRLSERLRERERIARELHDTLLQGFQGLILLFHDIAMQLPEKGPARLQLEDGLDRAEEVLVAGRDRVRDLRAETDSLPDALIETATELGRLYPAEFILRTEGTPHDLLPTTAAEMRSIGEEAIRNAFQHANASSIQALLIYRPKGLRLEIRDDGIGIAPEVVAGGGRDGHYGLLGMRERARQIGGKLIVATKAHSGTNAVLSVPASAAYASRRSRRRWGLPIRTLDRKRAFS